MNCQRHRPLMTLAVLAAVMLGATGCTKGAPSPPPGREATGEALLYVALGGDDVSGGRRNFSDSWPQLLFRTHLPVAATFVNLASSRQGVVEIRRDQVPIALRLRPDLVTITLLDDLERGTAPPTVQQELREIIRRLKQVDGIRVLVGTVPPGTGSEGARDAFNDAVANAARTSGADLVDLDGVRAADRLRRAQETGDAFARALRKS